MDNTTKISCSIATTDAEAPIGIEVWVGDQQLLNVEHVTETINFDHDIELDDGDYELRFVMKNKPNGFTKCDADGNIIKDACLTLSNLAFEEIELGQTFYNQAVYQHDFNGTRPEIKDQFFGIMGCNGTVGLKFTSPIYLWLLEHM
jgi:hypothetical protein